MSSWRVAAGAALVLACGAGTDVTGTDQVYRELQQAVAAELRPGAGLADVVRFLDARHIEHPGELDPDRTLVGVVRNTSAAFPVKGSVLLVFQFDAAGRLRESSVEKVFTGP